MEMSINLNLFLPKHIWIDKDRRLHHIDYTCEYLPSGSKINGIEIYLLDYIGYLTKPVFITTNRDAFYIKLYTEWNRCFGFAEFLENVGGNVALYKEIITLTTGENYWRRK